VKDIGVVAVEGGAWEIYVGGAAGASVRKGDLLVTVKNHADVHRYSGRFLQYYRENAKYLERTYGFVERIGIERLKAILIDDELGVCEKLDHEMDQAVASYTDPWLEAEVPAYPAQFSGPELVQILAVANNNG
jgi:nitrite reductase (NADH) large subunit